jgi:hypothetical protein
MSKFKRIFAFGVILSSYSVVAMADCNDIRANCNRNFQLDMRACGNFTDAQAQRCYERAHEQLLSCMRGTGC